MHQGNWSIVLEARRRRGLARHTSVRARNWLVALIVSLISLLGQASIELSLLDGKLNRQWYIC